jgi:hypothetical protein
MQGEQEARALFFVANAGTEYNAHNITRIEIGKEVISRLGVVR